MHASSSIECVRASQWVTWAVIYDIGRMINVRDMMDLVVRCISPIYPNSSHVAAVYLVYDDDDALIDLYAVCVCVEFRENRANTAGGALWFNQFSYVPISLRNQNDAHN